MTKQTLNVRAEPQAAACLFRSSLIATQQRRSLLVAWADHQASQSDGVALSFPALKGEVCRATDQWVGPLAHAKWALFARGDFKGQLKTLADARPYTIGGYLNDSRTAFLERMGGFKLDIVYDDMLNPKKLAAGRIDLWISSLYGGRQMAATVGVSGIKPVLVFHEVDNYLACGPKVPTTTIAGLQQALEEMRRDGTSKRITDSYLRNY